MLAIKKGYIHLVGMLKECKVSNEYVRLMGNGHAQKRIQSTPGVYPPNWNAQKRMQGTLGVYRRGVPVPKLNLKVVLA